MLWSIQPSQGSGCSKSLQCRLDPSARHDSGARKLRCWLRRMGWCQSLVDFYFVFLYFVGNMSMYHPCWKQLFRKHPLRLNSGSFLLRNNAWGKAARILYTLRKCLKCFKDTVTVPVNPWGLSGANGWKLSWHTISNLLEDSACIILGKTIQSHCCSIRFAKLLWLRANSYKKIDAFESLVGHTLTSSQHKSRSNDSVECFYPCNFWFLFGFPTQRFCIALPFTSEPKASTPNVAAPAALGKSAECFGSPGMDRDVSWSSRDRIISRFLGSFFLKDNSLFKWFKTYNQEGTLHRFAYTSYATKWFGGSSRRSSFGSWAGQLSESWRDTSEWRMRSLTQGLERLRPAVAGYPGSHSLTIAIKKALGTRKCINQRCAEFVRFDLHHTRSSGNWCCNYRVAEKTRILGKDHQEERSQPFWRSYCLIILARLAQVQPTYHDGKCSST